MTSKRQKNPEILAIINPTQRREMQKALRLYRKFHGTDPASVSSRGRQSKGKKTILIALGRAIEIIYEPTTGRRKRIQWFHKFGKDAVLATDPDGKTLFVVTKKGARQVDFLRGIVS